jgi:HAD superfamily hydrolase (TIGR01662 family)
LYSRLTNPELIKTILFDLGETLIYLDRPAADVIEARVQALHRALQEGKLEIDYRRLSDIYQAVHSELSSFSQETGIETTTSRVLEEVLARLGIASSQLWTIDSLVQKFFEPEIKAWILYDDTIRTLSTLKNQGYCLAVVSNARSHWAVLEIMKRLKIDDFFKATVSSAGVGLRKPRPEIYLRAISHVGSSLQSTVMVGNTLDTDILGAKRLKTRALYLEREVTDRRTIEPDATVRSLSDIPGIIAEWRESRSAP